MPTWLTTAWQPGCANGMGNGRDGAFLWHVPQTGFYNGCLGSAYLYIYALQFTVNAQRFQDTVRGKRGKRFPSNRKLI